MREVALCSASLLGGLFSLYVLLLSRDIPSLSLSLALSVYLLSVEESVVYDGLSYSPYLPISTMG